MSDSNSDSNLTPTYPTIEQLEAMSKQDIFNYVSKHLITQNRKSMSPRGCAYRGENNTSCAVGCLIPENLFRPEWNNACVERIIRTGRFKEASVDPRLNKVITQHKEMLSSLQSIHDGMNPSEWKEELSKCAINYELEIPSFLI